SDSELIPTSDGRSIQARLACHLELARLPAEGLEVYRKRVDAQAKRPMERALQESDPAGLARPIDEAFGSRSTPQALGRLGHLARREGNYADILQTIAKQRSAATVAQAGDWTTFAGSSSRNRVLHAVPRLLDRLSQLGQPGPAWRFDLYKRSGQKDAARDAAV